MNLSQNSFWKILLIVFGGVILTVTLLYSNFLAEKLKENEEKNIYIFKEALKEINNVTLSEDEMDDPDIEYEQLNTNIALLDTIIRSFPLPIILEDANGELEGQNFSPANLRDPDFLQNKRMEFLQSGLVPISGISGNIYYFNSPLLSYIKLFPFVQTLLVALFIGLGYFLFSTSRKAEQNRVWAGMAKETAHQLGTPISAILGWLEYLKDNFANNPDNLDIIQELHKDVDRLELVADRFSKIGSEPVLDKSDIYLELQEVKNYIQRRSPRKVSFEFSEPEFPVYARINKHLFAWVIENLMRNSLDALDGKGVISCQIYIQNEKVCIDLSDTGQGIPSNKFNTIFKPGYSTKKRGWGLGLSLAKRIIEEYHKGKIFVKSSKPNELTTFTIRLNRA
ncbi:MAG: HAMP domain-containing histidine kinase [Saprospiraceae bacterium]|nr:HAMP domain-containing histidine kinase [Saprospiraceae bacterium]